MADKLVKKTKRAKDSDRRRHGSVILQKSKVKYSGSGDLKV